MLISSIVGENHAFIVLFCIYPHYKTNNSLLNQKLSLYRELMFYLEIVTFMSLIAGNCIICYEYSNNCFSYITKFTKRLCDHFLSACPMIIVCSISDLFHTCALSVHPCLFNAGIKFMFSIM